MNGCKNAIMFNSLGSPSQVGITTGLALFPKCCTRTYHSDILMFIFELPNLV